MGKKTTFGVIVGTRGLFNADLARKDRADLLQKLEKMGFGVIALNDQDTPGGLVETLDHARSCAKLFREHAGKIDGIIAALPNFGDEVGMVNALHLAGLSVPILLQASDDQADRVSVKQRRDSFCGKISVAANLRQYGIPFTGTRNHTCSILSSEFENDLNFFAAVSKTVKGLRGARIGAVGARPAAFQTVRFSEMILQATGITVVPIDLSEILAKATRVSDTDAGFKARLDEITAYGTFAPDMDRTAAVKQARLSVALENWISENGLDATAMQCWTSLQENYGICACLSLSLLSEKFIPGACEVDVCGAISMLGLTLASGKPAALADWNNNYGDDRDLCVCTHCGNFPKSFLQCQPKIGANKILGATVGENRCMGALQGKTAPGPFTYFRVSTDDTNGKITGYAGNGELTDHPFPMDGCIAVCRIPGLQKLMHHIVDQGFPHHVAMARSPVAEVLEEALLKYLKWDLHVHR